MASASTEENGEPWAPSSKPYSIHARQNCMCALYGVHVGNIVKMQGHVDESPISCYPRPDNSPSGGSRETQLL